MPRPQIIVINTSPLLALIAAWGNLTRLSSLYAEVLVSYEVTQEILKGGVTNFGITEFQATDGLTKLDQPLTIAPFLRNSLDLGEASVIQLALDRSISTVCIDEAVGRRVARLNGLTVTGSVGILLKAKQQDPALSVKEAITNMNIRKIGNGKYVFDFALNHTGDT